jgi:hypothetical protein
MPHKASRYQSPPPGAGPQPHSGPVAAAAAPGRSPRWLKPLLHASPLSPPPAGRLPPKRSSCMRWAMSWVSEPSGMTRAAWPAASQALRTTTSRPSAPPRRASTRPWAAATSCRSRPAPAPRAPIAATGRESPPPARLLRDAHRGRGRGAVLVCVCVCVAGPRHAHDDPPPPRPPLRTASCVPARSKAKLNHELMTPSTDGTNYLSRVTVGAIEDLVSKKGDASRRGGQRGHEASSSWLGRESQAGGATLGLRWGGRRAVPCSPNPTLG